MEQVRGQDDRKRERHAMDGVWLPAGGGQPDTRTGGRQPTTGSLDLLRPPTKDTNLEKLKQTPSLPPP
jgi:hypothetical protein